MEVMHALNPHGPPHVPDVLPSFCVEAQLKRCDAVFFCQLRNFAGLFKIRHDRGEEIIREDLVIGLQLLHIG